MTDHKLTRIDTNKHKTVESVKEPKGKFHEWENMLVGKDVHSIRDQISDMIWDCAFFQCINESRKYAVKNDKGDIKQNRMVHYFINQSFFKTQLLSIRRLTDKRSDVYNTPQKLGAKLRSVKVDLPPETITVSGDRFMKNKRRNHTAQFKAKVAFEAAKGDKTIAQLASEYKVHPTQITQWPKQLLELMPEIFSRRKETDQQKQERLTAELYQQSGTIMADGKSWAGLSA